jgi:hypothetical protein
MSRHAVYQSTALIEPALIDRKPVENADSIEVLLKNSRNPYLKDIAKKLNIPEEKSQGIETRFDIINKAGYLLITGRSDSPQKAKRLVDIVCDIIIIRQNDIANDAVLILNNEVGSIRQQIEYAKKDVEQLDKSILLKEKTNVLAQSYIFQALIESKESKLKRQVELMDKLSEKEMELRYFTKISTVVAEATVPIKKIGPNITKIVLLAAIAGIICSLFTVFVLEYFEKYPYKFEQEQK